ncbi:MAG TPA: hypothetical protein VN327_12495 [Pseudonocardiaceae bacterium]|nr:hypothetical protein [Pseudonocardiaceae bacterium]
MGCAHVEHDEERGAGATAAANGQRRGAKLSRRVLPPITMTAGCAAVLGGLLVLFLGVLVGTSWTDQALGHRYRRQAIERRELDEWRRTLQETSQRCAWCGNSTALPAGVGARVSAASCGDPSPAGTAHAVGARR